jgi:hypothetical protein
LAAHPLLRRMLFGGQPLASQSADFREVVLGKTNRGKSTFQDGYITFDSLLDQGLMESWREGRDSQYQPRVD